MGGCFKDAEWSVKLDIKLFHQTGCLDILSVDPGPIIRHVDGGYRAGVVHEVFLTLLSKLYIILEVFCDLLVVVCDQGGIKELILLLLGKVQGAGFQGFNTEAWVVAVVCKEWRDLS